MDRHELGNMIFNLEDKKNLKEVKFTKSAVKEVLGYLKELYEIKNKEHEEDRRVALAEKDQAIESLQEINQSLGQTCNNDAKEIERLREQLTEKEKEVEYQESMKILAVKNQNQTAIEKLEKVKEWANNMYDGWKSNDGVNLDAKSGICNTLQAVCGMVNQQIKSLKGEK